MAKQDPVSYVTRWSEKVKSENACKKHRSITTCQNY